MKDVISEIIEDKIVTDNTVSRGSWENILTEVVF